MPETVLSSTAMVSSGSGGIPLGVNGAAEIFVDPLGSDTQNTGLSADSAYQTIGRAVDRMNEWLELGIDADFVINLANGTYNENVRFYLSQIPQQRVIVRGDDDAMTVVATGALTAATAQLVTDAGAAFGAANEQAGLLIEVFDPAAEATTRQIKTIRSHTATAIAPVGPFNPVPVAGWTYNVLTPAVIISGVPTSVAISAPALQVICPWDQDYDGDDYGASVWFAFLRVTSAAGLFAIRQKGGQVRYMGVVIDGAGLGFRQIAGASPIYGIFTTIVDAVFGTSATFSSFVDCCIGVRSTGGGIRVDNGSMLGSPVCRNVALDLFNAHGIFFGGAVHGANLSADESAELSMSGGGVEADDPLLPYLVRAAPVGSQAIRIREGSRAEIKDVLFQVCLGGAFHVNSDAFLDLRSGIAAGVGDVAGIGVQAENGGEALIGAGIADPPFTTGGTNIRVGNGATANGDSTFAALIATAPIYDSSVDNGRGVPDVRPGSMAAVWRVA